MQKTFFTDIPTLFFSDRYRKQIIYFYRPYSDSVLGQKSVQQGLMHKVVHYKAASLATRLYYDLTLLYIKACT